MTLVSVVLPTYDRREFLEGAVRSVLEQRYGNLELVVVDGGSGDGTLELLDSIDDDRLSVVAHDRPRGLSAARNAGLDAASGELVVFLDDDDRLYPEAVGTLVETIRGRSPDCAGVYAARRRVDGSGGSVNTRRGSGESVDHRVDAGVVERPENARIGGPSCTLVRRAAVEAVGGFDESLPACEDVDLWIRLFEAYHMVAVDRVLYEQTVHGDRMSDDPELALRGRTRLVEKHESTASDALLATLYFGLGCAYARCGRTARARRAFREAVRHDRSKGSLYYYLWLRFGSVGYAIARFGHRRVHDPMARYLAALRRGSVAPSRRG